MSLPVYTADQAVWQMVNGYWEYVGSTARSWPLDDTRTLTYSIAEGMSAVERQMILQAFKAWSDVADIRFEEVDVGQIQFTNTGSGAITRSFQVDGVLSYVTVDISTTFTKDLASAIGSYGYQIYMHEIGHALGLGHPGNYNQIASYETQAVCANDSFQTSVMSYFSQTVNPGNHADYAFALTPMAFDVAAIQSIYGAAPEHLGATVYGLNSTAGGAIDYLSNCGRADFSPHVTFMIRDTSGVDTIDFSASNESCRISLARGAVSDVFGVAGNMVIACDTLIENLRTGGGDDSIVGNARNNVIASGMGNDTVNGGLGNDRLSDAGGSDRIILAAGNDAYRATGDTLSSRDTVYGGAGHDTISTGAGCDILFGGAGNDLIAAGAGNDFLVGGAGQDTMSGGYGRDVFIFAPSDGSDLIHDFHIREDRINLRALHLEDWADLKAHMSQSTAGVEISLGDLHLLLEGVRIDALVARDFIL